jgi:hypothetical protein
MAAPITAVTVIEPGGIVYRNGVCRANVLAFSAQSAFGFIAYDFCRYFFFQCRNPKQKIDDTF